VQEKQYQSGQLIFSRGDKGRDIYFLRKGSVRIDLPLAGGISEHLATFCRGDFFGDMAFLVKGGRSANAVAEDEVLLYILSRSSFDELTASDPGLGEIVYQRLASALAERLRLTDIIIKALAEN
jgi:SulP family sulfate permease